VVTLQAKCLNACNVLRMFPPKSRSPRPQCQEVVSSSSSDLDPVENMVAIPVPAPSVIHTLVAIPEEFVPPILQPSSAVPSTPSPEYVQALEDDPAHDGTPEYWTDPEAGVDH
jgi:hypothetical protein